MLVICASVHAQTGSCSIEASVTQRQALATAVVTGPCRNHPGEVVKLLYDDNLFLGHFDHDGKATVSFVLSKPSGNDIIILTSEGDRLRRSIDAPDFGEVYRITMIWQAPVQLRLHVVEPGQRLGQLGDVNDTAPNTSGTAGLGRIDLAGGVPEADASGDQTTSEQSYVLQDTGARRRGVFTPYFEYPSRGTTPEPPYCGTERLASVSYRLFIIDQGRVTVDVQHESPRAACSAALANLQQRIQGLQ